MWVQCADITFNATAALLSDGECSNSTGVAGVGIQNVGASSASPTESAAPSESSGAAGMLTPAVGGSVFAGMVGLAVALL